VAELERGVLAGNHRLLAVRAHLLERAGDLPAASETFRQAARLAGNVPEQRFLLLRAERCASAENSSGST
jgi:predicted RNA polymerase sigma factor